MVPAQNYVSISRRPPDIEDYIDMLRRYRSWIIGPTFAGLVIATVVAFLWPDTFISTAVMRITPQQIPTIWCRAPSARRWRTGCRQMETEILSRTSLRKSSRGRRSICTRRTDAGPHGRHRSADANKAIRITPLMNAERRSRVSSAFEISFMYMDRYKAQAVVRELVTKFMEQNYTVQRHQANMTTQFLSDELKAAKDKMDALDDRSPNSGCRIWAACRSRPQPTRRRCRPTSCNS